MSQIENSVPRSHKFAPSGLLLICLPSAGSASALSQDRSGPETIEATARGTETQTGKGFAVTLTIYEYSPRADKQILIDAFQNGKIKGCIESSNVADFAPDRAPGQQHKMKGLVTVADF
jgi:hypothetical protein